MRYWRTLLIVISLLTLAGTVRPALAQMQDQDAPSQARYIAELKQRNAAYGPGFNGIGISIPVTVEAPADMTSRWAAGHSACTPGLRFVMTCAGDSAGDERVIACLLRVAEGQSDRTLDCDQLTLITPGGRYTADAALSDTMAATGEGASRSCEEPQALAPGLTIAAPFHAPVNTSMGDLAVMIDVDGAEVPAFLIPAGQLTLDASSNS
jgi:hypothetical protein